MPCVTFGLPDAEWDRGLFESGGHFMQSGAWMAVQQALGDQVIHQQGDGWRLSAVVHSGRGLRWLYAPYGPAVADRARLRDAVAAIHAAGRELKADFVRVEPDLLVEPEDRQIETVLTGLGARRVRPVQPRHTLVIDLRRPDEELRGEMLSGRRRSINTAAKKGITTRRTRAAQEAETFLELIHKTGERTGFHPHADAYYRVMCAVLFEREAASLYLADVEGQSVAAVIAFETPTTGYYGHAADDPELSRRIVAAAPLAWRIVQDCRAEGRTTFDFWGVTPDDGADHPWAGLSRFKRSFGGRMVTRPGTYDLPLRPLRYRAYRLAREARGRRHPSGEAA